MNQREFPQYQRINIPPPLSVGLLEIEWSEDTSHSEMSELSEDNPLTVFLLVIKCQHKNIS